MRARIFRQYLRDIILAGVIQDRLRYVAPWKSYGFGPETLREAHRVCDTILFDFVQCHMAWAFDINRSPIGFNVVGNPPRTAYQLGARWMFADAYQDAFARWPRPADGMRLHIVDHVAVDVLGCLAQCDFAQSG